MNFDEQTEMRKGITVELILANKRGGQEWLQDAFYRELLSQTFTIGNRIRNLFPQIPLY